MSIAELRERLALLKEKDQEQGKPIWPVKKKSLEKLFSVSHQLSDCFYSNFYTTTSFATGKRGLVTITYYPDLVLRNSQIIIQVSISSSHGYQSRLLTDSVPTFM